MIGDWYVRASIAMVLVALGRQAIIDWTRYLRAKWEEGDNNDFR